MLGIGMMELIMVALTLLIVIGVPVAVILYVVRQKKG